MFCHIVFSDIGTNKAHCPCLNPVLKMDQVVPPISFVSRPGQMAMSACPPTAGVHSCFVLRKEPSASSTLDKHSSLSCAPCRTLPPSHLHTSYLQTNTPTPGPDGLGFLELLEPIALRLPRDATNFFPSS